MEENALRPHRSRYWLNPKIEDPKQHALEVQAVCDLYEQAEQLLAEGVHVVSTDEKTSIQALSRAAPTLSMLPGCGEKREFEYVRNGTTCLTANFEVATGRVLSPTLGATRGGGDFEKHIRRTISTDPKAGWLFILDNLSTHSTEALVRFVVELEGLDVELEKAGKSGVLKNAKTRRAFLSDEGHRVRFVYTPKHCSWLNQVEIWFSILVRRVLKRGSFSSVTDLQDKLSKFIRYFNRVLAKQFRWTYTGRPLTA